MGLGSVGGLGPWSGRVSHPFPAPTHPEWTRTVNHQLPSIATKRLHQMRASRAMAAALVGVVALAGMLMSSAGNASASSCSGPLTNGEIRVVLVVDSSDLGGGASATCLVVPAGTTGSQLLARRGSELGTGSPRYGSSGLLCAIDGRPATGCGDKSSSGFGYWAYFFEAGGNWNYGNGNPFTKRLADGAIEGWRFVVGGCGCGQDPTPRIGPSLSLFPALAPAPAPAPELSSLPASGSATGTPSGASTAGTTASTALSGGDVTIDPITGATSGVLTSATSAVEPVVVGDVALAASSSTHSTTGRWIGIAAVFGLIAVMAGGAWVQTRRSR